MYLEFYQTEVRPLDPAFNIVLERSSQYVLKQLHNCNFTKPTAQSLHLLLLLLFFEYLLQTKAALTIPLFMCLSLQEGLKPKASPRRRASCPQTM